MTQPILALEELDLILAGPLLRRVTSRELTLWLVSSQAFAVELTLISKDQTLYQAVLTEPMHRCLPLGERVFVHFIAITLSSPLPEHQPIEYALKYRQDSEWISLWADQPDLSYAGQPLQFEYSQQIRQMLHGSCRKPHHPSQDALVAADQLLATAKQKGEPIPDLLVLSGDQVYVDDLCGPLLVAIHQVIRLLGLPNERFQDAQVADAEALYQQSHQLYQRRHILPQLLAENRWSRLFTGSVKPVFTSTYCDNHLMSFAEVFVLYLLCWSPVLWRYVTLPEAESLPLSPENQLLYRAEKAALQDFVKGLPQVRRLLAHIPTYMIFDDHDITDDWNLTLAWEQAAYGHAFSKRIIGNALMAYWICQGWGNSPTNFGPDFWQYARQYSQAPDDTHQDQWIQHLLDFQGWQYSVPSEPKLLVLDTRTRRWHSEDNPHHPSGLMNWEALSEMQQELMHHDAVVMVSPAPIFGVKLVETIQGILTLLGYSLAVDAENWMAHDETANTLLNIFKHGSTPRHFVILSGDVHYSFVYDIVIRFRKNSPKIWQITASGIKNEFPHTLLKRLAQLNRVLFHRHSPLNWLTKRKRMLIEARHVNGKNSRKLFNQSAIGLVKFNVQGAPHTIQLLTSEIKWVSFTPDVDSPIGPVLENVTATRKA